MPRGSRIDPLNKRAEALAAGLLTFDTGLPCVKGHTCPRYTESMLCVECKKLTFKTAYTKNKDRWLSYAESWRENNRCHVNEYAAQYRKTNPVKAKETLSAYRQRNKAKHAHRQQIRNTQKKQACPLWLTKAHLSQIEEIYIHSKYLSEKTGIKMAVDHIVPLKGKTVCGLHVPWNLQIIDAQTNSKKHAALTEDAYRPAGNGIMVSGKALPWNWRKHEHYLDY